MSINNRSLSFSTIKEALDNYFTAQIEDLAQLILGADYPKDPYILTNLIVGALTSEKVKDIYEELDDLQKAAIAEVVHSDKNYFIPAKFEAKYGKEPVWETVDKNLITQRFRPKPTKLYLFFYIYYEDDTLIMPDELKQILKSFVPIPAPMHLDSYEKPPETFKRFVRKSYISNRQKQEEENFREYPIQTQLREQAACDDLLGVLRLITTGQVIVSEKTRYPNTVCLKKIASVLSLGDYYTETDIPEIQPFAWCFLLQAGGLVEGTKLQLTVAGQKALTEPAYKTLKQLWKKWLKTKLLDELRRINNIKGQTGKGQRSLTATEKRRLEIINGLKDCPVGGWIAIGEFFRYMQGYDYDFQVARNLDHFKLENVFFGDIGYYEGTRDWAIFQGRYILCLLLEYVATLGMIDVAYIHPGEVRPFFGNTDSNDKTFFSPYDGLLYFRLNPLGAYCLDITHTYTPAVAKKVSKIKVLANWEIIATEPLASREELQLEAYTEKISDSVWKLTEKKLLEAHSQGFSLVELTSFLNDLSDEALPTTVHQLIEDLQTRVQTLNRRGMAILIDCNDVAVANLIANDSRTKNYCLLAGESCLVIPQELETKFRQGLQKLGYTLPK